MDYSIARKMALRLLSMRNYHSRVLARKLEMKGCSLEVCEKVIQDCKRLGFLKDDEAILGWFRRGYGPRYIGFKLDLSLEEVRKIVTRGMQREKIAELYREGLKNRSMARRRPEFEPGHADGEAAQLEQVERCSRVSNSVAGDDARTDFSLTSGIKKGKMSSSREKAIRALQRRGFDLDIVIENFSWQGVE
jgi:SOS response regulatory protein OraA/RecX